jgi:hypothetical protein
MQPIEFTDVKDSKNEGMSMDICMYICIHMNKYVFVHV